MLREQMPRKLMENEREEERHCDGRTGLARSGKNGR